ncbi:peptidyl-tRNA hydrolase [Microthyrium microscopicum]|uniref:peptidyl-tRNA hydrolase n=1 Tax=Microthyrium microscopicum TaxID=703497 RepID=A0A6A6U1X9_9PEZI|nr:peptidyl-tRNA hydrolase [Microthyrium microscopicum]
MAKQTLKSSNLSMVMDLEPKPEKGSACDTDFSVATQHQDAISPPSKRKRRRRNPMLADDLIDESIQDSDASIEASLQDMSLAARALGQATKPLLIISLGNPGGNYSLTRHNAGHIMGSMLSQRSLELPSNWSIRKTSSYMNVSGPAVAKLIKKENADAQLVILHDDLERDLGSVRVRAGKTSAQGHNGIKSIQQQLPGKEFWRICIGVGRPNSRDQNAVSDFVLSKMKSQELEVLRGKVDEVIAQLAKLSQE